MDPSGLRPSTTDGAPVEDGYFGHPRGLFLCFFTETWERFSYYGMRAILVIYMITDPAAGGLGWSDKLGGLVYGIYTGSVYVLGLLGGWIADRFIGQRKAVFWGGVAIMAGHICLAFPSTTTFYVGLVLIAIGTGFLKPNVSTMVGQLYADEDQRRDAGYSIYYMGINLGALLGPLAVGYFAQHPSFRSWLASVGVAPESAWHFGFAAAAVGMFFGLIQYSIGARRMGNVGKYPTPPKDAADAARSRKIFASIVGVMVVFPLLIFLVSATGIVTFTVDIVAYGTMAVLLLVAAGFFFAMFTVAKWTPGERKRIIAILALFFGAVFFFSVFEQAGSTFTVFAEKQTVNSVLGFEFPSSWWQSVNSLFIITMAPLFAILWTVLARIHKNPSWPVKFGVGLIFVALGCLVMVPAAKAATADGRAGPHFLLILYFLHTCGELCLSPVGLSATSKSAPKQIAGLAMGVWFMGTGIGNYFAGMYLGWTEDIPLVKLFVLMAIPPVLGGLVFLALSRPLRRASES